MVRGCMRKETSMKLGITTITLSTLLLFHANADDKHGQSGSILGQLPTSSERIVPTVPPNGDQNPYGVAFVPDFFAPGGPLEPGDILVSNFNGIANFQGTGSTIVRISKTGQLSVFFQGNPGLGLTTALGCLEPRICAGRQLAYHRTAEPPLNRPRCS
jgi:hypothetical protein